ncbi:hypothetical protein HIM_06424 [Hirsutella minnesotensis 3608]|uniref:ubiquitinyl hydrolase 1 n=1 Tax=Hirsutella minnesotensis 3608 TaxID=1043627 RepID=A0A0F7ZU39_9HYPO|nr:hypothetical protein HIM_06424 [Hirsutella minnesotensis 3608]
MREFPIKFLSLRDKNNSHRRSKSVPAGGKDGKARPLSAEAFKAMFKLDNQRQSSKQDVEKEVEDSKIDEIQRRLDQLDITGVTVEHIRDVLGSKFAAGDSDKAAEFIDIEQKAQAGAIVPYDPDTHLLGAENREGVTCYLDALLFAMFSKLEAFECMLRNDFPPEDPRFKLVNLLRIWVNMLRTGKLIHTDLTKLVQDALGDCGWADARLLEQQDTSEAFAFLTESLQLPLLSLQVDLFHQGKKDKDDHKVVFERLLNLAVPSDPEGKGVKLEDCLEEYFNARVDVLRDSEEAKKSSTHDSNSEERPKVTHQSTVRPIMTNETLHSTPRPMSSSSVSPSTLVFEPAQQPIKPEASAEAVHIEEVLEQSVSPGAADDLTAGGSSGPPLSRDTSTSVIRRIMIDEQGRPTDDVSSLRRAKRKGSNVVKAITIPAWQFFRLIPWHALTNSEPRNDTEVAMNFDQRPIVGICLKRYAMAESGQPQRLNTFIDIPDSLRLPHFMLAGGPQLEEENGLSKEYKLVLQSVVCHRGDSLQSGHYVAFARMAPKLLRDNRRHTFDPPPDYEEARWVRFDDLETENRVTYVDDIKQSFKEEMPYLLFYQVVPMVDVACPSTGGTDAEPPSYDESKTSLEMTSSESLCDGEVNGHRRILAPRREDKLMSEPASRSKPPSIRLSSEAERPHRIIFDKNWTGFSSGSTPDDSRRQSVVCTDSGAETPAITPDAHSPVIHPVDDPPASRLSRAASRFALGRQSRSASQSGEGRLSFSMTRLGGLMKSSKEPLTDVNGLSASITSSSGLPTSDASAKAPDSPTDDEKAGAHSQITPTKPKGAKSKDKAKQKQNDSSQPERECSVM